MPSTLTTPLERRKIDKIWRVRKIWFYKERSMRQNHEGFIETQKSGYEETQKPEPWGKVALGVGPFLLLPLIGLLGLILTPIAAQMSLPGLWTGIALVFFVAPLILIVAGWVKDFPRWCFPYWGFVLLILLYLQTFNGTIMDKAFKGDWRVWLVVVAIAGIGLLWRRSLQPVYKLFNSIWKDWTLLSFTCYGALPLMFFAAYDETRNTTIVIMFFILILAVGAALYMRSTNKWQRIASLVGGFGLAWSGVMIHLMLYWSGRSEPWMENPASWVETLKWTSRLGAVIMVALMAPVVIEGIRYLVRRKVKNN